MAANRRRLEHGLQAGDLEDLPASGDNYTPWKDKAWQGLAGMTRAPHERAPHRRVSHGRVPHERASHWHAPHKRVLYGACISCVHLIGVCFIGVYPIGVCFIGVYPIGVYLTGVYVMGMHLIGMHLIGVYIMGVHLMRVSHRRASQGVYLNAAFGSRWCCISHFGAKWQFGTLSLGPSAVVAQANEIFPKLCRFSHLTLRFVA
jgi:hypothetical protein